MPKKKRGDRGAGKAPPSYRLHKQSGQAILTFKGKDYYLGPHGTTESLEKYHQLCRSLLSGQTAEAVQPGRRHKISQLTFGYWEHAQRYYGGKKNEGELSLIAAAIKAIVEKFGSAWCDEFGPLKFKAVRNALVDRQHNGKGLTRTYINKLSDRIKRMFRWGVEEELCPAEVAHALAAVAGLKRGRTKAVEPEPIEPVDDAAIDATLPHLPPLLQTMVKVQRLTGMRPGEVCALKPAEIDRSHDVWLFRPKQHKMAHAGRVKIVAIGPKAQALLAPFMARDPDEVCFSPAELLSERRTARAAKRKTAMHRGNRAGTNRKEAPKRAPNVMYTSKSYRRAISRACEAAWPHPLDEIAPDDLTELQRAELAKWRHDHSWHPNQIRHTKGTEVRREYGLEEAQVTLGHAHMNVTEIYAEKDIQLAMKVARETG